ncbi:hypothetical protein [Shewanella metallivivens]|uniref:DUF5666 domain-containing protein n=1 Tax=Shewanella metallivivens TaxID=2872342 RepID=A0ABT5TLB0_9GAMM|nr:hypothetical protein [Shewanella metallivivens]MDD8058231.1 hypothetical protein [Shewanella metallivivens]
MKLFKLIFVLLLMSTSVSNFLQAKEDIGFSSISIYEVLVNPTKFHGEMVEITGVYKFDIDSATLFPSKEYLVEDVFESSISVRLPMDMSQEKLEYLTKLDGTYVRVFGEFDAKNKGYGGFNKGKVINVQRIVRHSN